MLRACRSAAFGLLAVAVLGLVNAQHEETPQIPFAAGDDEFTPELSRYIEDTLQEWNIPGLSVALVHDDGKTSFRSWGKRSEAGDSMTPDTLFHMASVSKAFLASAIGILMDDFANGKNTTALPQGVSDFTWDTKIKDILPAEWELMDSWASEKANMRDILSHISGLPRHDYSYGPFDTPQDVVLRMKHLRPAFEFREQWSYNNQMFMVGAHIISTYAQPYTAFVEERIFAPLDMLLSTFSPNKATLSGKLTQAWDKNARLLPEWFNEDVGILKAGPGGIISNAIDMSRWITTWLNSGIDVRTNQTIIPLSAVETITNAYAVASGKLVDSEHSIVGYSMGWFHLSYLGHNVIYHTGSIPGFSTRVSFLPQDKIGVLVFANAASKAEPVMKISERIISTALGLQGDFSKSIVQEKDSDSHRDSSPDSKIDLNIYSGTYSNPGYGAFALCGPSSDSSYCTQVLSDFATVDAAKARSLDTAYLAPQLLAQWPRVWSSHVRLRHIDSHRFTWDTTNLFPHGYGIDKTAFEMPEGDADNVTAEFVVEDGRVLGFGVFGLVGEVTERERKYITIQDKAEAWFEKL